jgi:hypothetical protein
MLVDVDWLTEADHYHCARNRANRLAMIGRANFYKTLGYDVVLFDLPARAADVQGRRILT